MTRRGAGPAWSAALLVAALVAGCGGDPDPGGEPTVAPPVVSPFAACDPLTEPPGAADAPPDGADGPPEGPDAPEGAEAQVPDGEPMPALTLPCFTGDTPFALPELRGPAVVNLWASWCYPCQAELPVLQRLADRADGELHVLGVVTGDTRRRAASFAEDFDLRFASLHDPGQRLLGGLEQVGLPALPVTVFVDRDGRIAHVYQGPPYDDPELAEMVAEHLRVEVPDE